MLNLLKKQSAIEIAARVAEIQREHDQAKAALKATNDRRAALPFDADSAAVEELNAEIRRLEDTVKAKDAQTKEGRNRLIAARAAEAIDALPRVWNEAKAQFLEVDRLARLGAAAMRKARAIEHELSEMQQALQLAGRQNEGLLRPMTLTMHRAGAVTRPDEPSNDGLGGFRQFGAFPLGVDYEGSAFAALMNLMRTLGPDDAKRSPPKPPAADSGGGKVTERPKREKIATL